jgi:integral membrane sensor domain MASE1
MKFVSLKDYIIDNWEVICKRIGLGIIIGGIISAIISALIGTSFQTTGTIWIISNTIGQIICVFGTLGPNLRN